MRLVWRQRCGRCPSVGTSAVGRYQTSGGTFSRPGVAGEIANVVEDAVQNTLTEWLGERSPVSIRPHLVRVLSSPASPLLSTEHVIIQLRELPQ